MHREHGRNPEGTSVRQGLLLPPACIFSAGVSLRIMHRVTGGENRSLALFEDSRCWERCIQICSHFPCDDTGSLQSLFLVNLVLVT
jgi:hypothetical protein